MNEGEALLAGYSDWRQSRLAERMGSSGERPVWHHLITVLVYAGVSTNADAMARTLSTLLGQTHRNIEIVVAGVSETELPDSGDFVTLRGLFAEPALDPLHVLSDPTVDRLWRGTHIVFAPAGTTFDPDAFALLNRMLSPSRGASAPDLIICDHDRSSETGTSAQPCFLPGWDPDLIVAMDYVGTAFMASRKLLHDQRSGRRPDSLHGWLCNLAETPFAVGHLTETVMHLPIGLPRPLTTSAAVTQSPRSVAIVIPNRDQPQLLERCVRLMNFLDDPAPELVIVDHASTDLATLALYAQLEERHGARIVKVGGRFNFSRMVNLGVAATSAEVVVLVNNDVEVTDPSQVKMMLGHAIRPEVGVVGARLLYPDGTVQHAGIVLGAGTPSEHPVVAALHMLRGAPGDENGYLHVQRTLRNYQAVTGAIIATRRAVFEQIGGFDEVSLPVEYNDIDYCLRARAMGLRVIAVPTDGIIHRESATRGFAQTPEVQRMRSAAMRLIAERWGEAVKHDPFRNPHVDMGEQPQALFPWTDRASIP